MHQRTTAPCGHVRRYAIGIGMTALAWLLAMSAAADERPAADTPDETRQRIALWPGDGLAPGDAPLAMPERMIERSDDPALPDRYIDHVQRPSMTVHRPTHPSGAALLVIPGGGYQRVVLDKEGSALLPAFVDAGGITLFVLRYRLPGDGRRDDREVALGDAQRAMRLIRARATEFGIDPRRVGVMGFSAGGHVAASLATRADARTYPAVDAADALDARPDFQLLLYPVIDMGLARRCASESAQAACAQPTSIAHPGSRQRLLGPAADAAAVRAYSLQTRVDARTPPAFLVHAQDDAVVPVDNSLRYYDALRHAGVPAELHLFAHGGHGFGVRGTSGLTTAAWPRLALDWIAHLPAATQKDSP